MMCRRIRIADDHPIVLAGVRNILAQEEDLVVVGEASTPAMLAEMIASTHPHAVITDYSMPGGNVNSDGLRMISFLKRTFPETPLIILTVTSNVHCSQQCTPPVLVLFCIKVAV